jgi:hypothetical protein
MCCEESWLQRSALLWQEGRFGGRKRAAPDEMSDEASKELYKKALTEAAKIASCSVSPGFEESRQKTFADFEAFLARIGHGLNAERPSDLDVIAFV